VILAQLGVELANRVRGVGAIRRDGALDAGAPAVPDLHLAVSRTDEEDVALLGVGGIDHGHGIGLVEASQKEEAARLAKLVVHVVVAWALSGARDDGHRIADGGREALTALEERREVATHAPLDTIGPSRWPA
jgi:hypothetical protein